MDSNDSWSGALFFPTVLCPFTATDYLYLATILPSSSPSALNTAVAPESHPTYEQTQIRNIYVHF